jgi:Na+/H+ antiporter NhaD/arsenite permease-like protein
MSVHAWISVLVFVGVIFSIAKGYLTRATATLMGASLLMFAKVIPADVGFAFIDFKTLGLLIGMMIIVGVLSRSGVFQYVAVKTIKLTGGNGFLLLFSIVTVTALLSAFLDNVTTVLLISPIVLSLTDLLGLNPVPFLVSEAFASNIGGAATLIGDPPNIIIGSFAGFSFIDFLINLAPVAFTILIICGFFLAFLYRKDLKVKPERTERLEAVDETKLIKDPGLMKQSLVAMVLVLMGFVVHHLLHLEASVIALFGAALLLTIIPVAGPEIIHEDVEWPTLVFFASLFIMVGALKETGVILAVANLMSKCLMGHKFLALLAVLWVSGFACIFINPVAFAAIFVQVINELATGLGMESAPLFWALAMGACFGGNGSYLGATANVVLADVAERNGHPLSFSYFLRIGLKVVALSLVLCSLYIVIRFRHI